MRLRLLAVAVFLLAVRCVHADTLTSTLPGFYEESYPGFLVGTFVYVLPAGQTITSASLAVNGVSVSSAEYSNPTFYLDGIPVGGALVFNPVGPTNFTFPLMDFSFLTDGSAKLTVTQEISPGNGIYVVATGETLAITTTGGTAMAPEPSGLVLLGTGLLGVCGAVRRRLAYGIVSRPQFQG